MKNLLSGVGILVGMSLASALAAEPAQPGVASRWPITGGLVARLTAEARTNQPALRAVEERIAAALFNVASVRQWEDPQAKFGGTIYSENGMEAAQQGNLTYGVDQKLPLWGKPELARGMARAEVAVQQATYEARAQAWQRDVAKALFRIALAERVVELGEQDLAWLATLLAMTEEKYRLGLATQTELIQLQNEQSKRRTAVLTARSQSAHEQFALNRLVNRSLSSPWPGLELPAVAAEVPYQAPLRDRVGQFEPRLRVLRQEQNQADATTRWTRRQRLPDVSLGVEGRQYGGDGGFREGMFTVSMNIPWFNRERYRNEVRREEAKSRAVGAELAELTLSLQEEVHRLTVELATARREALVYRDEIVPRTRQALASGRAAWETNRGMLRDLLETRRMLLEGELMQARAVTEQHLLLADVAALCGLPSFDSLEKVTATEAAAARSVTP